MFLRVSSILVALALVTVITGCGSAPENEMNASEMALENARLAEAENYAPILYQAALDSMNAARVELQTQDAKFVMFRSFDRATQLIVAANTLADQARTEASAEKDRIRTKNQALIDQLTAGIASTRAGIEGAPKSKGSKADLEVMKADLATIESAFATAVVQHNADSLLAAQSVFESVESQLTRINGELEAARQKVATQTKK